MRAKRFSEEQIIAALTPEQFEQLSVNGPSRRALNLSARKPEAN